MVGTLGSESYGRTVIVPVVIVRSVLNCQFVIAAVIPNTVCRLPSVVLTVSSLRAIPYGIAFLRTDTDPAEQSIINKPLTQRQSYLSD
jgi:hypothetical protein